MPLAAEADSSDEDLSSSFLEAGAEEETLPESDDDVPPISMPAAAKAAPAPAPPAQDEFDLKDELLSQVDLGSSSKKR